MRLLPIILPALVLLVACQGGDPAAGTVDAVEPPAEVLEDFQGELSGPPSSLRFMPCGTRRSLVLAGPGLDSLTDVYRGMRIEGDRPMKAWIAGRLVPSGSEEGLPDSLLWVVELQHIAPDLRCPPQPRADLAAHYHMDRTERGGLHRTMDLHLHADGSSLMITDLHDGRRPHEMNGHWGLDMDDMLVLNWPVGSGVVRYQVHGDMLVAELEGMGNNAPVFERAGEAEVRVGVLGEFAELLVAEGARQGIVVPPDSVLPEARLDRWFRTGTSRTALDSVLAERYRTPGREPQSRWSLLVTVGDVVQQVRKLR